MTGATANTRDPAGETPRRRKFGVYDSMILISGIAVWLAYGQQKLAILIQQFAALCHTIAAYYGFVSPVSVGPPQFLMKSMAIYWSTVLWYFIQALELLILIATPVFLLMRVRQPRPPLRALLGQPGTIAGLAATFGLIWVTGWLHFLFFGRINDGTVTAIAVGVTVALAWTCLALSRQWKAEPRWVDRMGRLLGAMAIAIGILAYSLVGI